VNGTDRHYLSQIDALNQRGGRTLSIIDLIRANTISAGAAAYVGRAIGRGASFLTAANPGGAGKTALLAALLGFLPDSRRIVAVDGPAVLSASETEATPACYLAHEIGAGHWYGYIWGASVGRFLALAGEGHTAASCLHADLLEELYAALAAQPLEVDRTTLLDIDLILFMHVDREGAADAWAPRRRVAAVYESDRRAGEHRLVFRWEPRSDALEQVAETPEDPEVEGLAAFLEGLLSSGTVEFAEVRRAYLALVRGSRSR
jgi:hypothetical protein